MNSFEDVALRLKQQLRLGMDKDVAEVLGLSKRAWAGRKVSGKFPEKELRALAQQRPDLGIDVDYVLTGWPPVEAKGAWVRLKAELGLNDDAAVAEWLAMSIAEVNACTRRGVFPTRQFLAACAARPELVDKDYVLTGVGMAAQSMISDAKRSIAAGSQPAREQQIIDLYRSDLVFRSAVDAVLALAQSTNSVKKGGKVA